MEAMSLLQFLMLTSLYRTVSKEINSIWVKRGTLNSVAGNFLSCYDRIFNF